jgi:hypothetical protein
MADGLRRVRCAARVQKRGSGDSNPVQFEHSRRPNLTPANRMSVMPIQSGSTSLPYGVTDIITGHARSTAGRKTLAMRRTPSGIGTSISRTNITSFSIRIDFIESLSNAATQGRVQRQRLSFGTKYASVARR